MADDENSQKTTGTRGLRRPSKRFLAPEQIPRFHCDVCKRDISRKIRIKCADCPDFDLCVECFAVGVEYQDHKKTHRYRVIDDLSFPVFSSSWGADEELLFFDGICGFGLDNWEAVAHFVGSKSPEACKQHYAELIDRQHWGDDDSQLPDPEPSVSLAPAAFPFEFESEDLGESPRSVSTASSFGVSQDSVGLEDIEEVTGEWICAGSMATPKSSLAEGEANTSTVLSDGEGTNEIEVETSADQIAELNQEMDIDKLDENETPEQTHGSDSEGHDMMDHSMSEGGSDREENGTKKAESIEMGKTSPPSVAEKLMPGMKKEEQQQYGSKRKRNIESFQMSEKGPPPGTHSFDTTPGGGLTTRSLSLFDTNAGEVTGYNPFRREFDPPYDTGAEHMIADLEFFDDDTEEVTKAKLKLLDLYRWRVHHREKKTDALKKNSFGLLDVKKIMTMERQHSWSMNERCADLRAFARFENLQKIDSLAKGFFMERTLRKRITELQEARSQGCRTFADIKLRHKDARIPKSAERSNAQMIGKWRRHAYSKNSAPSNFPYLTDRERQYCQEVSFSPWQYAVLRDRILREAEEHGGRFSKSHVKSFFRLECSQAVKLFDFFVNEGVFVNSDKDMKEAKKLIPSSSTISKDVTSLNNNEKSVKPTS